MIEWSLYYSVPSRRRRFKGLFALPDEDVLVIEIDAPRLCSLSLFPFPTLSRGSEGQEST